MANFAEALDHQAQMRKAKPGKKALDHVRIEEAENGGHVVEHHFDNSGPRPYVEPKTFAFSEHQGAKPKLPEGHVLHHVAKAMNIEHEVIKGKETHGAESEEPADNPAEQEVEE